MIRRRRACAWMSAVCGALLSASGAWSPGAGAAPGSQERASADETRQRGVIVPIEGEINDVTYESLSRRLEEARSAGAAYVVLELNTPGGLVTSTLDICNYLKNVTDVKTVAWVHPHAFSAGALIAVACHEIVMSSSSRLGDVAPIIMSPTEGLQELGKTERAKAESPILKEFRDSAHRRGYDALLCEAMVRLGNEIYWIENTQTGERKFVRAADRAQYLEPGDESKPEWKVVRRAIDPVNDREVEVHQPVVATNDLLTLTQTEAMWFGFARAIVSSDEELAAHYGLDTPMGRLDVNWAEAAAAWLSSPIIRSILFVLMLMGAYAEFHAPGHMVGGTVALIALALFLGAPYLTGLAGIWEMVLLIIGVGLLCIELFLTPGFALPGVLGIALILVGLVATFVQPEGPALPEIPRMPGGFRWPQLEATWHGVHVGITVVGGGLLAGALGAWGLSRVLPRWSWARRFIGPNPAAEAVRADDPYPSAAHVGDEGTSESLLRPAGKARFGPLLVDVVSESEYIPPGSRVRVIERRGNRVVVRRVRD